MARYLPAAFWTATAAIFAVAIMPHPPQPPGLPSDKVQHIIAFIFLAAFAAIAYPRISLLRIGILLSLFGALIEFAQMIPGLNRHAEVADWIADTVAAFATLALVGLVRRLRRRRFEESKSLC
jgi:VanZ family protein